jgi:hypothetical protein
VAERGWNGDQFWGGIDDAATGQHERSP